MTNVPRTKVLWFGSGDVSEFEGRLKTLGGLQLSPVANERELIDELSTARAAVFEFDGNIPAYIARIRRTREFALQNGVLIVLVNGKGVDPEVFQVATTRVFADTGRPYGPEYAPFRPIRAFRDDLCRAAHEISIWQPGPTSNSSMKIKGKFNADHESLLRRGFSDLQSIEVSILTEGKSGARVYSVTPLKQPRTPFLAKIDETDRIAAEADRYFKYVNKTVGFNNRPNLDTARTVFTPSVSILVEDFLERARPIYDVLPNSTPATLISSIFEGALRNWRRDSKSKRLKLSHDVVHLEKILKLRKPTFFAAAERAKRTLESPFDGEELLSSCDEVETLSCTCNRIHGDLHAGNIYITSGSSEAILIDFYKTDEGPTVLDPACLEVDIVFNRAKAISHALALKLYKVPLELPSVHIALNSKQIWLLDTVRAIRMFGFADMDRRAYTFAVSCYLIRYASFDDSGTAGFHMLRRFRKSQLIRAGIDPLVRNFWFGHADKSMDRVYAEELLSDAAWLQELVEKAGLGFDIPPSLLGLHGLQNKVTQAA
ncbi:MAG: hypothetical protein WCE53_05145 [Candidatus Acidiferrum sp.]